MSEHEKSLAEEMAELDDLMTDEIEELHPLLTAAEVSEAKALAAQQVLKESRAAAKKAIIDAEIARIKREQGLVSGDADRDRMVNITMDLAEHSANIIIDGRPFWHGHTYEVPAHQALTLCEIMQRGWQHQDEIDGKSLAEHYKRARATAISPVKGIVNAPRRADEARV